MKDNRLPLLLDAAKAALIAIGDVGVHFKYHNDGCKDDKAYKYLLFRSLDGKGVEKNCEEAFKKLQEALKQFDESELED